MVATPNDTCENCFRALPPADAAPQIQWVTYCRCNRPFSPKNQFSIDVCANCKQRVADQASNGARARGVCACQTPSAIKVPAFTKPSTNDPVTIDLTTVGLSNDRFPVERFTPISVLKDGPKATTILARDRQRGSKVVVKCFKTISQPLQAMFESDLKKNQKLTQANIAKISFFGAHNGTPYVVTEYKEGFNIEQCIALHGYPSYDVAVKILISLCEAITAAQKEQIFHRELRPGNVIFVDDLNAEPATFVTDFALPKLKLNDFANNKEDAMWLSADVARGLDYSEKSEVYMLGCIGYLLLSGKPSFQTGSPLEIKNNHALKLPPRISDLNFDNRRPKDLDEVIEKCLEKDPKDRFESVAKLQERLEVFPRREQMRVDAILASRQRKKLMLIAAIVLAVMVVGIGGFFLVSHH